MSFVWLNTFRYAARPRDRVTGEQVMTGDNQRARMLAGRLYAVSDPELAAMGLTHAHNHSGPDDRGERTERLGELLGALGDGDVIEPPFHCDYAVHIRIGAGSIVLDNIPPRVLAAGTPCRVIRPL